MKREIRPAETASSRESKKKQHNRGGQKEKLEHINSQNQKRE